MTGNTDKIRSLILAALMVFSVFAGTVALTGSVAAANEPTVDAATEYGGNVEVAFNQSVELAVNGSAIEEGTITVYVDGTPYTGTGELTINSAGDTDGRLDIGLDNVADVDPVDEVNVEVPDLEAASSPGTNYSAGNITVDVTSRVVQNGTSDSTRRVYVGEVLALDTNGTNGGGIVITEADGSNLQLDGSAPTNGQILDFDTEGLSAGTNWSVEFDSGTTEYFQLNNLNLQATAAETSIQTDDTIEVDISAVRTGEQATVELIDSDDNVDASQTVTIPGDGDITVTFTPPEADDYTVEVTDNPTGVTASTDTITVSELPEVDATIDTIEQDQRGDVFNISLDVTDGAQVSLSLGSAEDGYLSNVTATDGGASDGSEDGQITLQWNSYLADSDQSASPWSVANSDDDSLDASGVNETSITDGPTHIIASGSYDIEVQQSAINSTTNEMPGNEVLAVGTLSVSPRSTDGVTVWTAPSGKTIEELSDITAGVGTNITQDTSIATGDKLVLQIEGSGLEGYHTHLINNGGAADATEAFLIAANASLGMGEAGYTHNLSLQQNVGQASNDTPTEIYIANNTLSNADGIRVIPNFDGGSVFAVVDTGDSKLDAINSGEEYEANFTLFSQRRSTANFGLVAPTDGSFEDETVTSTLTFDSPTASIDTAASGDVEVRAESDQEISGTSTLAAGTELAIRLQTQSNQAESFIIPATTTVESGGEWSTTVNISDFVDSPDTATGVEFDVRVRRSGTTNNLATAEGVIVGQATVEALTFDDQQASEVVTVQEVQLSAGGYVAIHEGSATGPVVGASSYLQPGETYEGLRIALDEPLTEETTLVAMPHQDTDGDNTFDFVSSSGGDDGPYTSGGSAVTQSATITPPGAGDTATPTEPTETATPMEPTETATPMEPTETATPDDDTPTPTEGDGGPGFTAIVALLALIAAALIAVRREQ